MLQSPEPKYTPNAAPTNSYTPVKPATSPLDQANIGRSLVIKGEITGAESLFIDGRVEGSINFPDNRVTVGRNGNVAANIIAKEVVIKGSVEVRNPEKKDQKTHAQGQNKQEAPKAMAATAGSA